MSAFTKTRPYANGNIGLDFYTTAASTGGNTIDNSIPAMRILGNNSVEIAGDLAVTGTITGSGLAGGTISGPSSSTVGNLTTWNNTTGTTLADGGVAASNLITAPTAATSSNQVTLSDTGTKAIKFLANGSDGQALTLTSGVPGWKTPGAAIVAAESSAGFTYDGKDVKVRRISGTLPAPGEINLFTPSTGAASRLVNVIGWANRDVAGQRHPIAVIQAEAAGQGHASPIYQRTDTGQFRLYLDNVGFAGGAFDAAIYYTL